MFHRHVQSRLSGYCSGKLDQREMIEIEKHLVGCDECRQMEQMTRESMDVLNNLPEYKMPQDVEERVRERLRQGTVPVYTRGSVFKLIAAILAGFAIAGALVLYNRARVEMKVSQKPASQMEQVAQAYYHAQKKGNPDLDLKTSSPAEARAWIRKEIGIGANLAIDRPSEDGSAFQLLGVKKVVVNGSPAALISYNIEGRPVTLITASLKNIQNAPPQAIFSKRVFLHSDRSEGTNLISWTISGQTYTLASELPNLGYQGCFICHTQPDIRKQIHRAVAKMESGI